jgi:hypothetical protein
MFPIPSESEFSERIRRRLLREYSEQVCIRSMHSVWSFFKLWSRTYGKNESEEFADSYRPISLLSIVRKILERCVCDNLYHHVSSLISNEQHGFIRNPSCVIQLLPVIHAIGENLDQNIQTDILYLDFAKAFDSVDHNIPR